MTRSNDGKLYSAIRKYGLQSFAVEELYRYPTRTEAEHAEVELIHHLKLRKLGYNTSSGGECGPWKPGEMPVEVREKKRASMRRAWARRPEWRQEQAALATGRAWSTATRDKQSEMRKGKKHSPEHVAKIAAANRGKKRTAAQRAAMALSKLGAKHTKETKRKIGAAQRGRIRSDETRARIAAAIKKHWKTRRRRENVNG